MGSRVAGGARPTCSSADATWLMNPPMTVRPRSGLRRGARYAFQCSAGRQRCLRSRRPHPRRRPRRAEASNASRVRPRRAPCARTPESLIRVCPICPVRANARRRSAFDADMSCPVPHPTAAIAYRGIRSASRADRERVVGLLPALHGLRQVVLAGRGREQVPVLEPVGARRDARRARCPHARASRRGAAARAPQSSGRPALRTDLDRGEVAGRPALEIDARRFALGDDRRPRGRIPLAASLEPGAGVASPPRCRARPQVPCARISVQRRRGARPRGHRGLERSARSPVAIQGRGVPDLVRGERPAGGGASAPGQASVRRTPLRRRVPCLRRDARRVRPPADRHGQQHRVVGGGGSCPVGRVQPTGLGARPARPGATALARIPVTGSGAADEAPHPGKPPRVLRSDAAGGGRGLARGQCGAWWRSRCARLCCGGREPASSPRASLAIRSSKRSCAIDPQTFVVHWSAPRPFGVLQIYERVDGALVPRARLAAARSFRVVAGMVVAQVPDADNALVAWDGSGAERWRYAVESPSVWMDPDADASESGSGRARRRARIRRAERSTPSSGWPRAALLRDRHGTRYAVTDHSVLLVSPDGRQREVFVDGRYQVETTLGDAAVLSSAAPLLPDGAPPAGRCLVVGREARVRGAFDAPGATGRLWGPTADRT